MLVFEERGKPEYPEKNLSVQRLREPTHSTHIWRRVWESNPGNIGGRRVPEEDCLPRHWLKYPQPERKSSSESSDLWCEDFSGFLMTEHFFLNMHVERVVSWISFSDLLQALRVESQLMCSNFTPIFIYLRLPKWAPVLMRTSCANNRIGVAPPSRTIP